MNECTCSKHAPSPHARVCPTAALPPRPPRPPTPPPPHYEMFGWGTQLRGVGASGRLCVIEFWPGTLKHDFSGRGRAGRLAHARIACLAGQWGAPGAPLSQHYRLQGTPHGFKPGAAPNQGPPRGPRAGLARGRFLRAAGCHRARRVAPTWIGTDGTLAQLWAFGLARGRANQRAR